jgi:hypothetical protein
MSSKPRILVLQPDKGLAESIYLGLRSMTSVDAEVDVALAAETALRKIRIDRYDLLIVQQGTRDLTMDALPHPLPVVSVGGPPNGSPRTGLELLRVPLPLSFNLLEESVAAALNGVAAAEPVLDEPEITSEGDALSAP